MNQKKIRVRFPPSPTGNLHIGNARTALFNYLYARHYGGDFIFRIEDTDALRSMDCFVQNEIDALRWLGIEWDEGIEKGGSFGPYRQSQRIDFYMEFVQRLLLNQNAYYCFCSPEELEQERKLLDDENAYAYKYAGKCRYLTQKEIENNKARNIPYTIRFKLPDIEKVEVNDLVRGPVQFPVDSLDDFILVRSNGMPTYNLAVMVDDATMNITHVIRGEDHFFGNTPRQILLYSALSLPLPSFGHMPMILGTDRSKLSKRHGAFAVTDYKSMGFLPEALNNYMALLGWSPGNDLELMNMDELIQYFDLEKVQSSPAIFDFNKLKWFNGQYLRKKDSQELVDMIENLDEEYLNIPYRNQKNDYLKMVDGLKHYAILLRDIPNLIKDIESYSGLQRDKISEMDTLNALNLLKELIEQFKICDEWSPEAIKNIIRSVGKKMNIKGKMLFHPIRLFVTNTTEGPDLNIIIFIKGKEKVLKLLEQAFDLLTKE